MKHVTCVRKDKPPPQRTVPPVKTVFLNYHELLSFSTQVSLTLHHLAQRKLKEVGGEEENNLKEMLNSYSIGHR